MQHLLAVSSVGET